MFLAKIPKFQIVFTLKNVEIFQGFCVINPPFRINVIFEQVLLASVGSHNYDVFHDKK